MRQYDDMISGSEKLPLQFHYQSAIQGYGSFTLTNGIGMQIMGLQLTHSNYDSLIIPWSDGDEVFSKSDHRDRLLVDSHCLVHGKALAKPGIVLRDSKRTGQTNTLKLQINELTIDAYRPESLSFKSAFYDDTPISRNVYHPWHPHMKMVEDREFPINDGYKGFVGISDLRLMGKPFCSTIYCKSSVSFDTCDSYEEAVNQIDAMGEIPIKLVKG